MIGSALFSGDPRVPRHRHGTDALLLVALVLVNRRWSEARDLAVGVIVAVAGCAVAALVGAASSWVPLGDLLDPSPHGHRTPPAGPSPASPAPPVHLTFGSSRGVPTQAAIARALGELGISARLLGTTERQVAGSFVARAEAADGWPPPLG